MAEMIEKRLENLHPVEQNRLAEKIISNITENSNTPTQILHSSCFSYTVPFVTGLAGALIGAAAVFFLMTFFAPTKVEIREIVREVRVEVVPESKSVIPVPVKVARDVSDDLKPSDGLKPPQNWIAKFLPFSVMPQSVEKTSQLIDIDAMLAEREALAKRSAAYESRLYPAKYVSDPPSSRMTPKEYREIIESLTSAPDSFR